MHRNPDRPIRRLLRCAATGIAMITVAGLGAVAVTAATVPSPDGTISACRHAVTGELRVIDVDAGQSCQSRLELPLTWNQAGSPGPAGPAGAQGPAGPPGPGITDTVARFKAELLSPGETTTVRATCPIGSFVTGGGFFPLAVDSIAQHMLILESQPFKGLGNADPDGYQVRVRNNGTATFEVFTTVMCAS